MPGSIYTSGNPSTCQNKFLKINKIIGVHQSNKYTKKMVVEILSIEEEKVEIKKKVMMRK